MFKIFDFFFIMTNNILIILYFLFISIYLLFRYKFSFLSHTTSVIEIDFWIKAGKYFIICISVWFFFFLFFCECSRYGVSSMVGGGIILCENGGTYAYGPVSHLTVTHSRTIRSSSHTCCTCKKKERKKIKLIYK